MRASISITEVFLGRLASAVSLFLVSISVAQVSHAAAAFAAAETSDGVAYYWAGSLKDEKSARIEALQKCKRGAKENKHVGKCRIALGGTGPAYWAVFHAENGAIGVGASPERQVAVDNAYSECAKLGNCPVTAARVWWDEGQLTKTSSAPAAACSPPVGETLRYSDRCINGDCIRTFQNGCSVRFQAAYCFDPLQQRWAWKPDGC